MIALVTNDLAELSFPLATATLDVPAMPANSVATHKVLHVINGEHYSGAERVQDLLAQELPHSGYDVSFACVKPGRFPEARSSQSATLYKRPMRRRLDRECARQLADLIRDEQFSLVHAHTPRSLLVGSWAAKQTGVPLVYHVHSPTARDSTRRWQNFVNAGIERWCIRRAAKLIAVSPSLAEMLCQSGVPQERVAYVPNGVPSVDAPIRSGPTGTWTLGMAALFRPRKGIEVLLEALAMLRSRGISVHLRAVGPFETQAYRQEVQRLAKQLGIEEAITWTGFVEDINAELRKVDLFVLPSLFGEGLPMVLLEAMAAGVPVVASDVEGVPTAVRQGQEGLLVVPGSSIELSDAIEEVVSPTSLYDYPRMSRRARERHADCFSASAMAEGVARIYDEVLGS